MEWLQCKSRKQCQRIQCPNKWFQKWDNCLLFKKIFIYFWLCLVLVATWGPLLRRCAGFSLVVAARLRGGVQASLSWWQPGSRARGLCIWRPTSSGVAAHRLSCPAACGISVPWPGIKLMSPALDGGFLTTGPPGESPDNSWVMQKIRYDHGWLKVECWLWTLMIKKSKEREARALSGVIYIDTRVLKDDGLKTDFTTSTKFS